MYNLSCMCDWCGHTHPVTTLCSKRPTWGRRGFLALLGAGLVGAALPQLTARTAAIDTTGADVLVLNGDVFQVLHGVSFEDQIFLAVRQWVKDGFEALDKAGCLAPRTNVITGA